jgi:hypothetical protein
MLAFSISPKDMKTPIYMLWKNFAQNENNTKNTGVFANGGKKFGDARKKISSAD